MKKVSFFAAVIAVAGLASCTAQAPKANLKSDIDTLSYMMGIASSEGLEAYVTQRMGLDTTYYADFIDGVISGMNSSDPEKDRARLIGMQIGQQISGPMFEQNNQNTFGDDSTKTLSKENFLAGFLAKIQKKSGLPSTAEASAYATKMQFAENKAAGEKFLAENATKEGVKTTASGLQYKIIKEGDGEIPTDSSTVKVNYRGTLIDGTEFDSSYKRNEPASFPANRVIKGWTEALTMMPVGSKWEVYIPYDLAYGENQSGQLIKPFSALVFEIELLEIEK